MTQGNKIKEIREKILEDGVKTIILKNGMSVLVSEQDYDMLSKYTWSPHKSGRKGEILYVYSNLGKSMHRMLLQGMDRFKGE